MPSLLDTFMQQRATPSGLSGETPLEDVFDSLALLDLFLLLESSGLEIDLDNIASCTTLGQLRDLIDAGHKSAP